jgi:hypothetical protein
MFGYTGLPTSLKLFRTLQNLVELAERVLEIDSDEYT